MRTLEIMLKDTSYNIYIKKNILHEIGDYLISNFNNRRIVIITDTNCERLYADTLSKELQEKGYETGIITITPGEESKNIDTLQQVYKELSTFKIGRQDLIIAFGGGVVGDLAGFAASTYLRGVDYVQIPTSLLAQVDSSIGGKVAVDLPFGKNLVGSFYHPKAVFIDAEVLKTLGTRFLHDGLAEVIKYGFIKDETIIYDLLNYKNDDELLQNIEDIIYKCCSIKKSVVEADEKDFGERMLLNFGHTLGHAIEKYFNYKKYSHGEAVAIGMAEITKNSEKLCITQKGTYKLLEDILKKFELPYEAPEMERDQILETIVLDKKNSGNGISLILLDKIGVGFIKKIPISEIDNYI